MPVAQRSYLPSVFAALASDARIELLHAMRVHEADRSVNHRCLSISQLAAVTEMSRFSASRHLSILRDAGLVEAEHIGQRTLHRLNNARFEVLEDWLYPFLDTAADRVLDQLSASVILSP